MALQYVILFLVGHNNLMLQHMQHINVLCFQTAIRECTHCVHVKCLQRKSAVHYRFNVPVNYIFIVYPFPVHVPFVWQIIVLHYNIERVSHTQDVRQIS